MRPYRDLAPSLRMIMTPGPVEVDPRVLRAMSLPFWDSSTRSLPKS